MNAQHPPNPFDPTDADPNAAASIHITLRDTVPQLRAMLADEDWLPAIQDAQPLQALLTRLDGEPGLGEQAPPADVALLVAAYNDFCRFRRTMAARLNEPDGTPFHATPEEWLQRRLHRQAGEDGLSPYADYHLGGDRFHING